MGTKSSPSDIINLKLILVSGKTAEFQFPSATTALDVAKYVFENWPEDWGNEEKADRYEVLRLIYQGRFLHGNVTLSALRLQQGKTTVMHLIQREHLPDSTNGDQKRKHKHDNNQEGTSPDAIASNTNTNSTPGCCDACIIL
ncbi:unnamed protein product [Adineta steineri]|uniref:Ubiquitin-like domain-containing protein n=1 Tax=Adineta steineri TaxID=433720 RepID=A0A813XZJ6_9BILA|nr:unnamed protein product [Adineta steineri]CAF0878226.1 unnamed protein product [Adineta steineri]CAF1037086.1 unnamed protein product [Adineta steineri]CAF1412602.1 unnamed protein product [Adineta steineri]CAF3545335.1 unnamed protein product [Adineta steineri]